MLNAFSFKRTNQQEASLKCSLCLHQLCCMAPLLWLCVEVNSSSRLYRIKQPLKHNQIPFISQSCPPSDMSFKKLKIKSSALYIINKAGQNRARVTRMLIIHWLVAPLSTLIPPRMHTYTLLICYDLYLRLCLTSLWVCALFFTVNGCGLRSSDV